MDPPDITLVNLDNENYGYTLSAVSGSTSEDGGTASFTVSLDLPLETTDNVTLTLSSLDTTEGMLLGSDNSTTVTTKTLTWDNSSWNTVKTVLVKGINDNISDGSQAYSIRFASSTPCLLYKSPSPRD